MARQVLFAVLIFLMLIIPVMPSGATYDHTSTDTTYWGRTLVNSGDSVFLHPSADYATVTKEALNVQSTSYAWAHNTASKYYQYDFYLDNDLAKKNYTVIYTADSTSDWSIIYGTGSLATDTTDKVEGTASVKYTASASHWSGGYAYYDVRYNPSGSWDASNKEFFVLNLKFSSTANLFRIRIMVTDTVGAYKYWDTTSITTDIWRKFVLPFNNPTGSSGTLNLAAIDRLDLSVVYTSDGARNFWYDDGGADVGNWAQVEVNVPDDLASSGVKWRAYAYNPSTSQYRASPFVTDTTVDNGQLQFMDGTLGSSIYATGKGIATYAQGARGSTQAVAVGDTAAGSVVVSSNYGSDQRIVIAAKLPPDDGLDSSSAGISQVKLRIQIYYASASTSLVEDAEYGYEAIIPKTGGNNWLDISAASPLSNYQMRSDLGDVYAYSGASVYSQPLSTSLFWVNRTSLDTVALKFGDVYADSSVMPGYAQLKEHKNQAESVAITFTNPNSTTILVNSIGASGYRGTGYVFYTYPSNWLNGKTLAVRWTGSAGGAGFTFDIRIYDGSYSRSSATDFPSGSAMATKGAGLLQTISSKTTSFGWTIDSAPVNVAASTQGQVTVFIRIYDNADGFTGSLTVDYLTVTSGGVRQYVDDFTQAVTMTVTGTELDYGYSLYPVGATENVTLVENSNYWRRLPFYKVYLKNEATGATYSNSSVTVTLANPLSSTLTLYQSPSPLGFGLYEQPSNMTATVSYGSYSYSRTLPINSATQTVTFYLGDPTGEYIINVWISELNPQYINGYLYVYRYILGGARQLLDVVAFTGTLATPSLQIGSAYLLDVVSQTGITYQSGSHTITGEDIWLSIITVDFQPPTNWKPVSWGTARSGDTVAVSVSLSDGYTGTLHVYIYNITRQLVNTPATYTDTSGFTYNWGGGAANQTYTILLNGTIPNYKTNFQELKDVHAVGVGGAPLVNVPVLTVAGGINTNVFGFGIVFLVLFLFGRFSRLFGMLFATTLLGLLVYFGWISQSVISYAFLVVLVLFTVFYGVKASGGESQYD